jgi:hypothetical protein
MQFKSNRNIDALLAESLAAFFATTLAVILAAGTASASGISRIDPQASGLSNRPISLDGSQYPDELPASGILAAPLDLSPLHVAAGDEAESVVANSAESYEGVPTITTNAANSLIAPRLVKLKYQKIRRSPTPTPTVTPFFIPFFTPTATRTVTATVTPTLTATATASARSTPTINATPTSTATPAPSVACTLYVSPGGSNSGPGTKSQPFNTLQEGLDAAKAGDTVCATGTFRAGAIFNRSGTANGWITLAATTPLGATISLGSSSSAAVNLNAHSYVAVENLEITGGGWGIINSGGGAHWKITGNEVTGTQASAIQVNNGDYADIENNIVVGCAGKWSGSGSGISVYKPWSADSAPGYHITIANNFSYANENPQGGTDGNGIIIDSGLSSSYSEPVLIENNVGYGNAGSCVKVYLSTAVTILNNTCWNDYAVTTNSFTWRGEVSLEESKGVVVANNILIAAPWLNGANTAILDGGGSGNTFANNLTYDGTNGEPSISMQSSGSTMTGNLEGVNPMLVNPAISFMLQSASPAIGAGTTAYGVPPTDITGTPRPRSPVDLGAYQH